MSNPILRADHAQTGLCSGRRAHDQLVAMEATGDEDKLRTTAQTGEVPAHSKRIFNNTLTIHLDGRKMVADPPTILPPYDTIVRSGW